MLNVVNNRIFLSRTCRGARRCARKSSNTIIKPYALYISLWRYALRARFVKSGRNALRPYISLVSYIVHIFGISLHP